MIPQAILKPNEILISTIRHGLTELNRDKRVGGHIDVPLLEEGREQARIARENFAGTPFDVVITSPLQRAIETAEIVTDLPREKMVVEPLCIERFFGQMEGLTRPEVEVRFPQLVYLQIEHVGYSLNPPGGESFEALRARAQRVFEKILSQHRGMRVIIFSHQNWLQQINGLIQGRDPYDSLRADILNLELNQFHLAADGTLISHQKFLLCPNADKHASF